ncbi:ArsR/SmtB family transcription factor [Paenibacillus sp. B01]|uniref:ArsR/SmtB family transcription factor n=1 Tax=Paenibacillus sp. B01 TaxID=2660554 RepID=UPI00129AC7FC|nr:metalloregulator ArsR/SmtB family transcription factor [Paenibacillus sp. B01]QGG55532.1 metalloregulator ArsR/SmtB family transcription factor [Paenibacillus sp. B01]
MNPTFSLGLHVDTIFMLEKFYLDLNLSSNSPSILMQEISTKYNIPIDSFEDETTSLTSAYEKAKKGFLNDYEAPSFVSDFNQFFYVESPADFSPAFYLYLFAQAGNPFSDGEQFDQVELEKRKFVISQVISDDFDNFKPLNSVHDIVEYLRRFPTSNHKRWISILLLHYAKQITDQLLELIARVEGEYMNHEELYRRYSGIDIHSDSCNQLVSSILGDTKDKEVIRIPSVTCFNAVKLFDDEYSNRIYVFIGVLYDRIGDLIKMFGNNDKLIVSQLKAIGENNRIGILRELKKGPMCGKDIASLLNLTPATVSHHMNNLVNEGLVNVYKDGTRIDYKVNHEVVQNLLESLRRVFF